ncbi:MAG: hypothetical protein VKK62_07000, partial [Synechococcaceae cyanobacterium]|nr:hypothetical protein [Synechococcaceae cyanobacterium]
MQASNAVLVPGTSRIDPSGASDQITDGFVVRVLGTFGSSTPVVFDYVATAFNDSVAFTAGVAAAPV